MYFFIRILVVDADDFVLDYAVRSVCFNDVSSFSAYEGTAYRGFIGDAAFEWVGFSAADDGNGFFYVFFHIFDGNGRTNVTAVLFAFDEDLSGTDLLFLLNDTAFQECLGILCFIIFGVF